MSVHLSLPLPFPLSLSPSFHPSQNNTGTRKLQYYKQNSNLGVKYCKPPVASKARSFLLSVYVGRCVMFDVTRNEINFKSLRCILQMIYNWDVGL